MPRRVGIGRIQDRLIEERIGHLDKLYCDTVLWMVRLIKSLGDHHPKLKREGGESVPNSSG
jgi:hypothetical protein